MRKIIFTLMLAIVSSVWMTSEALCLAPIPNALYQPSVTVSGTFVSVPIPCEPIDEYPCPACLTLALQTSDRLYYLTADNADIQTQLEAIEYLLSLNSDITGSVSGTPYTEESYEYIRVQTVDTNSAPLRLPSLCDEWNVLEFRSNMGFAPNEYYTRYYHLTTDTIIAEQRYIRLYKDNLYMGAIREGNNRDIYYIPAGTTHEYLLYSFNAQIGDVLTDLWLGHTTNQVFTKEYFPYGVIATVEEITEITPRRFVLSVGYVTTEEGVENYPYYFEWIEGIGFASAPDGADNPLPYAGGFMSYLLCAYKNGEQVYVSEMGEQYGCEYNYNPDTTHTDTIPLYAQDDSGSSTVDPVDPNQIYATLTGDVLTIHNRTGVQVTFTVNNISVKNVAARVRSNAEPVSFTDSVSIELSEDGIYEILLTSEEWNYTIFGTVNYIRSATEITKEDPASTTKKILRGTQILIEREGKTYTLTGQEVK